MNEQRYNVVAVRIDNSARRTIAMDKSEREAEAIVRYAVIRRGVEEEFFVAEPVAAEVQK